MRGEERRGQSHLPVRVSPQAWRASPRCLWESGSHRLGRKMNVIPELPGLPMLPGVRSSEACRADQGQGEALRNPEYGVGDLVRGRR
jgi:hypothetical protein